MNYSLDKIAKELQLSKTTVSLVINGKSKEARISEDVEKRIKDFCEQVHYSPNIHAQRMNRKYVKNVGLLIDKDMIVDKQNPLSDSNISEIIGGVILSAEEVGYRVTMQLYYHQMDENRVFEWLRTKEIDGLIYYGLKIPESWQKVFAEEERKIVGIGIEHCEGISSVNINNFDVMYELTSQIIKKGKKKFLYVDGVEKSHVSRERKKGFLKAIEDNRINFSKSNIIFGAFSNKISEQKLDEFFKSRRDIDAIVCANDEMAVAALNIVKRYKLKGVTVTGADNMNVSHFFSPSITTIDNMNATQGDVAFKMLIKMIRNKKEPEDKIIKSSIIYRDTFKI